MSAVDPNLEATASPDLEAQPSDKPLAAAVEFESGLPSDVDLMLGIQSGDADALSQLYDRYNGIMRALILRIIHNETEADDLLQEVFMEIWNQAKNFSADKGKPLGWMVTLTRRRAIDALRKKQAYARAEERLQAEPERQPLAWVENATEKDIEAARKQYGSAAEDFINQCYGLHEAFALSLKPAKASNAIKDKLMSMVRERGQGQSGPRSA